MFASKGSGSESNSSFEIIDDEEVAAIEGPGYSFIVDFKRAVEEKIEGSEDILQLWHDVDENQVVENRSDDQIARPLFVDLQAAKEGAITSFLIQKKIQYSICVIHTPTPATPLRADPNPEKIEKGVVTEEIANDSKRLKTVTKRAEGIREYLKAKGKLYSIYKNDEVPGMNTLNSLVAEYPGNLCLKKRDDSQSDMPTGATYLYGNGQGLNLSSFIEMTQANVGLSQNAKFGFAHVDLNKIKTEDTSKMNKVEKHLVKIDSLLQENNIYIIEEYEQKVSTNLQQPKVTKPLQQHGLNAA